MVGNSEKEKAKEAVHYPRSLGLHFFFHFSFRVVLSTGQWGDARMPSPLCTCALAQNMCTATKHGAHEFS